MPRSLAALCELDKDSLLGHGSFGVVHSGTDRRTGQRVAVKVVSKLSSAWNSKAVDKEIDIMVRWTLLLLPLLLPPPLSSELSKAQVTYGCAPAIDRRNWIIPWPQNFSAQQKTAGTST